MQENESPIGVGQTQTIWPSASQFDSTRQSQTVIFGTDILPAPHTNGKIHKLYPRNDCIFKISSYQCKFTGYVHIIVRFEGQGQMFYICHLEHILHTPLCSQIICRYSKFHFLVQL